MRVRIFQPAKTAMQSGLAGTHRWVMEFEPDSRPEIDPLMGWTSSGDTKKQVRLSFESLEEAIAHAERESYAYTVDKPRQRALRPKSYSDNFRFDRTDPWTH